MKYVLRLTAFVILLSSCNSYKTKYPYSLSDFRTSLRPYLEQLVQSGGTCAEEGSLAYGYISKNASVNELQQLTLSEHPLLRAEAFRMLCNMGGSVKEVITIDDLKDTAYDEAVRKNSNLIDELLLNHLDDTAIITYCMGEWGNQHIYVSDYYLNVSKRKTKISDSVLEDKIIKNHSYLNHAYKFISYSKKNKEDYYPIIKAMVLRDNAWSKDEEYHILSALSEYKKPEDVALVAERLPHFTKWNSYNAFYIIARNPDTAYYKILEKFYLMFKNTKVNRKFAIPYNDSYEFQEKYFSFLSALAAYKNQQSLDIFIEILGKKIYPGTYLSDEERVKWKIYNILKEHECPVYKMLIASLRKKALEYEKNNTLPPVQPEDFYDSGYW